MTTTTSSPDRRFWTLLRGLLRRNLGAMIYFFLVTCFFFPVQYYLEIFGTRWNLDPVYWSVRNLYGPAQIYTAFSMVVMVIILLAAPVVIATSQMHYLHTRRSVDLYHSLPVTRRQLMLASGDMANDVGTVLYGEEAVTLGIIDHVGGLSDALDSLYRQMDRRREE